MNLKYKLRLKDIKIEDFKIYLFSLRKPRKFDFTTFSNIKNREYVKKISF